MINEHDRLVLTTDLPNEKLAAGDVGTVIHVYGEENAFEVEFVALDGETVAVCWNTHRCGLCNMARLPTRGGWLSARKRGRVPNPHRGHPDDALPAASGGGHTAMTVTIWSRPTKSAGFLV